MHKMQSAFRRLQWQIDKPGREAGKRKLGGFQISRTVVSERGFVVPIQVSWGHHVWLRNIKSRVAGNEDCISRLRIEISAR
jgi:hypothetical protein